MTPAVHAIVKSDARMLVRGAARPLAPATHYAVAMGATIQRSAYGPHLIVPLNVHTTRNRCVMRIFKLIRRHRRFVEHVTARRAAA